MTIIRPEQPGHVVAICALLAACFPAAAQQNVRALERNRREIFPNWRGRAMVLANRLFPGLVDRAVKRLARPKEGNHESHE